VVIVFMATRPEIGRVVALCMGLVASNHLHTSVFVSGESVSVSEAHIRTTGVGPDTEDHES
jgi:UDP-N-acetylglucosamine 2-epimerase